MHDEEHAYCPYFHHTIELIGRRWTGVILQVLSDGPARFAEIRASIPGLSDRLLTDRLTELEREEIVARCEQSGLPHYQLTTKGRQLLPVLDAVFDVVAAWSSDSTPIPKPGRVRQF